jgi:PIN domain nuclease of toxin-antitoxin system
LTTVLDTSAILAVFREEAGADLVLAHWPEALVSSVSIVEIVTKFIDWGQSPDTAEANAAALGLTTVELDDEMAVTAGKLRATTKHLGLSLGDRACLALAIHRQAIVLTADRAWMSLDVGCKIEAIR